MEAGRPAERLHRRRYGKRLPVQQNLRRIQDIADTGGEFWTPDPEYGEIRLHKGLLYDYYSIHTRIKGQENAALPQAHYEDNIPNFFQVPSSVDVWSYLEYRKQAEREAAQLNEIHNQAVAAAVNSASLDFTMHLPMAVDATNADQVLDDGKTLVWDLKPAFINTQGARQARIFTCRPSSAFSIRRRPSC